MVIKRKNLLNSVFLYVCVCARLPPPQSFIRFLARARYAVASTLPICLSPIRMHRKTDNDYDE